MRSARRSICSRVWWAPRKPLIRWRAGLTNILCTWPDGPAAPPRRISGARTSDRSRRSEDVSAHRDAGPGCDRREGARHCYPQPRDRRSRVARRRGGGSRDWRLRERLLSLHQRSGIERDGDLAGIQARSRIREPLLHPDPPHVHSGQRRIPVEADVDERVPQKRWPSVGPEEGRRQA